MNESRAAQLELNREELSLLESHLRRHIGEMDKELVRTDNPTLQHHIAREVKVLEDVLQRLAMLQRVTALRP